MSNILTNFTEQVRTHLDRSSLKPSEWIVNNFKHPRDDRKPWSWDDHEFQIDICDVGEEAQEVVVIKPAQTGLSTLQIRLILQFLATHNHLKACYILPTAAFAREFVQSRFDPAVESSPYIQSVMSNDADNTSIKKIGTCFLIMRGTSGTTAAISVDLDLMICDERDFANQDVLSSFASRLQHSDLKLTRDFSTPTLPGYGVSALYDDSSQAVRMVKHDICGQWVELEFFNDVMLPGDIAIANFRKEHLQTIDVNEAWFSCPHCRQKVTEGNLADPEKRQWVDKFPGHYRKGFKVNFFDVVRYNPLSDVLNSIRKYTYGDWTNFRIGAPYESSENSFMTSIIERNSIVNPIPLEELMRGGYYGVFIGVDLGKVAHVVVGVSTDAGINVICAEQVDIRTLPDQSLGKYLVALHRATRCVRLVVDGMPDYSVALHVAAMNCGYGATYGMSNKDLDIYKWDDNKGTVNISRDSHFDDCANWVNAGRVKFPIGSNLMKDHFSVVKKTKVQTAKGLSEKWTSTSDEDHFAHAFGYMFAAYASIKERFFLTSHFMLPQMGKIRMK